MYTIINVDVFTRNTKEILTGPFSVNMQFCCPEEWNIPITRGNTTAYSPKMDQSIFPLLYYIYWRKVDDYIYILLMLLPLGLLSVHVWYFLEYKPLGLITVVGLRSEEWGSNISTRGLSINEHPPPRPHPPWYKYNGHIRPTCIQFHGVYVYRRFSALNMYICISPGAYIQENTVLDSTCMLKVCY